MLTIKLQYTNIEEDFIKELSNLQRIQSNIIHIAFNRLQERVSENEISKYTKQIDNLKIGCWFNQSAIKEASQLYQRFGDKKIIFGGKHNLKQYIKKLIPKKLYKENKLNPLLSIGEKNEYGNRYFSLDIIKNNQIIFKPSRKKHFILKLPKLRSNYQKQLFWIENLSKEEKISFTVKLTQNYIAISFEEEIFEQMKLINNRAIAIDLNPNRIGYSICDYGREKQNIIETGILEYKDLNEILHKSSNSKEQLYQNNKRKFEQYQMVKFLIKKTIHFKCTKFIIEDFNISNKNHNKGKTYNRYVNNNWNRNLFINSLKKYCNIFGIKLIEINPVYSSIIGNVIYKNYPDPINASLEINRRGYFKYQKDKFYPKIPGIDYLNELWKQTLNMNFVSWKDLSDWLKKSKVKYRFSFNEKKFSDHFKFSRMKHINSNVFLYKYI